MIRRVLFLSNVPWDFVWQRHQTLASLWAERAEVDYVELPGVRRPGWRDAGRILSRMLRQLGSSRGAAAATTPPPPTLRIHRPWVLPAASETLCRVNLRLVERALARSPTLRGAYDLAVVYSPARTSLQWLDRVRCGLLVFDCTDDLPAVRGVPPFFEADEAAVLARADITLVPSRMLLERKRAKARRIARLPHGALVERFLSGEPRAARISRTTSSPPTLLYYGHLHRQHLDFEALDRLARVRPSWRLVLVGPERTRFAWPSNVELPGQVPHDRLREQAARADVLLLPYCLNRYTESVMPAKTYECLATGLPVVATPLPELVAEFSSVMRFVGPGVAWEGAVEEALREDTDEAREKRVTLAKRNSWAARFDEFSALVERLREGDR